MAFKEGPDEGWSWVVAFANCFISLILAGIFRTSGVLFVAFISYFGATRQEASWPMAVCIAVLNLAGPFCGILGQRFGARPIIVIGALIATVGISSCYLTTSLNVITFLFGGVFGIGYGFMNTVMPGILNAYFVNLRATANGIANAGSCIGSIILPVAYEYFMSTYGLSGCFLLTGGIVLHITAAGMLMRTPSWLTKRTPHGPESSLECNTLNDPEKKVQTYDQEMSNLLNQEVSELFQPTGQRFDKEIEPSPMPDEFKHHYSSIKDRHHTSGDRSTDDEATVTHKEEPTKGPRNFWRTVITSTSCMPCPMKTDNPYVVILMSFGKVLSCPMFFVTALTNVCFYFLYHMYVVIIVDYALDRAVPNDDAKHILFAFSIADLCGRLCLGWVTDRRLVTRSHFMMICMTLIGLVFFMFPFADCYWKLLVVSSCYGLLLGCSMVIFPILLVDFLGIELHSVSYGCMCFMNGVATFGRPFLIGYFRDSIGSYSSMFYVLGVMALVSASLWLLEKPFNRLRK